MVECLNYSIAGKRLGDPNEESAGFESWSSVFWTSLYLELHFFDVDWWKINEHFLIQPFRRDSNPRQSF